MERQKEEQESVRKGARHSNIFPFQRILNASCVVFAGLRIALEEKDTRRCSWPVAVDTWTVLNFCRKQELISALRSTP